MVTMEIIFPGGKKVDASFKGFIVKTDQPTIEGGDNSAPSPFDLFFVSLGTCAGFYVLSFLQERNIPTNGLKMNLRTERNTETGMTSKVTMDINLPSDFPEKYREAVIKSAKYCTVVKHIHNPPAFEINLVH